MKTMNFTAENIALIESGRKYQTRRPIKLQPPSCWRDVEPDELGGGAWMWGPPADNARHVIAPPYVVGEFVRVAYPDRECVQPAITIEITGVRCERLQAISEADAIAEGCEAIIDENPSHATDAFQRLWGTIYGPAHKFAWERDPFVFVYEFSVRQNCMGEKREALIDVVNSHLTGIYHCNRVWSAWQVGTMGEDDFSPRSDSTLAAEIVDAILAETDDLDQSPTHHEAQTDPADIVERWHSGELEIARLTTELTELASKTASRYRTVAVSRSALAEWSRKLATHSNAPDEAICDIEAGRVPTWAPWAPWNDPGANSQFVMMRRPTGYRDPSEVRDIAVLRNGINVLGFTASDDDIGWAYEMVCEDEYAAAWIAIDPQHHELPEVLNLVLGQLVPVTKSEQTISTDIADAVATHRAERSPKPPPQTATLGFADLQQGAHYWCRYRHTELGGTTPIPSEWFIIAVSQDSRGPMLIGFGRDVCLRPRNTLDHLEFGPLIQKPQITSRARDVASRSRDAGGLGTIGSRMD